MRVVLIVIVLAVCLSRVSEIVSIAVQQVHFSASDDDADRRIELWTKKRHAKESAHEVTGPDP